MIEVRRHAKSKKSINHAHGRAGHTVSHTVALAMAARTASQAALADRCDFQCWRAASGLLSPTGVRLRLSRSNSRWFGDDAACTRANCTCHDRSVLLADDHTITHVAVAAARHSDAARAISTCDRWRQEDAKPMLPPGRSVVVIVDNASPEPARTALRERCQNGRDRIYARNDDWSLGYGFELGAWRWAILHVLPSLPLRPDAIIYFTQDSLQFNQPALPYPPPPSFKAAALVTFLEPERTNYNRALLLSAPGRGALPPLESHRTWTTLAADALSRLRGAPPFHHRESFSGCFGPAFLATWASARALQARGFFDMLRVESKLDEQITERLIGWILRYDLGNACSVAGD